MVNTSETRNRSPSTLAPAPKKQKLGPLDVIVELLDEITATEASQLYAILGLRLRNRGFPRTLNHQDTKGSEHRTHHLTQMCP